MNKIKLLAVLGTCGFILGACSGEDTGNDDSDAAEVVESESVAEEPGLDDLDQSVTDEIAKIGSDEEVNWEKINLNKHQFKEYIESLDEQEAESSEESEDSLTVTSSSMTDDSTIEIVINNPDTSEVSELTNGFFALMMDSFSRQLYVHSDFSDGTAQPTIIIKDDAGNMISEATDFIDTEETE